MQTTSPYCFDAAGYLRPNLEYTVWYRLMEAPEWRTLRVLQKNAMEATIHNLLPGHEYEFMILSQDKYGDGMFSKQFRFSTQSGELTTEDYTQANVPRTTASSADNMNDNGISRTHTLNPLLSTTSLSQPWNLSFINNQQGWLLHWEHPERGLDQLRLYTVRWWKQPEHYLIGTVETFDNFYQLRHLPEDSSYEIQVLAVSIEGMQVPSHEIVIDVPSQRKVRAVLIGSSVCVAFLLCALCVVIYVKRSCLQHLFAGRENDDEAGDGEACTSADCEEINRDIDKITNA